MKLYSGKRVGQSGQELTEAVLFSFILHVLVLLAAVFLVLNVTPRTYVPPFYEVKLVGLPSETAAPSQVQPAAGQPAPPKEAAKPAPKPKKAHVKARKALSKKGALPELTAPKQKPAQEEAKTSEAPQETSKSSPGAPAEAAPGAAGGNIEVKATQSDFKYPYYLTNVRNRVQQNWSPPPSVKGSKVKITFTINRWGRLIKVAIDQEHSSGTYDFKLAAMRAIQRSDPFPQMPDDFSKESAEFSVDLMEE